MNIKQLATLLISVTICTIVSATEVKEEKIRTIWADKVNAENVWQSYPRPQLQRSLWMNLNGLWNYSVTDQKTEKKQVKFNKQILIPFAIESSLSGVQRSFLPTEKLWYQREFTLNNEWKNKNIILHFGAVDYECQVWINNKLVGSHKGGNNPFSFDVTKYLKKSGPQILEVAVVDPTDTESISRGKQQLDQKGIWYTPVSGVWQTVWMEAVNQTHILQILPTANIDNKSISLDIDVAKAQGAETIRIELLDNGKIVNTINKKLATKIEIEVPNAVLWTPDSPKLYDLNIELLSGGKTLDKVRTYFALREISIKKDEYGYQRISLNGKSIFQYGTLDQGWWPDGLLTPPSEEAMLWDMVQLKKMGFNTIRKHIKVEPEQYYHYADSLGLMIWQDMVSGFATDRKAEEHIKPNAKTDWDAPASHTQQWQQEMFEMIDRLRFYSCITTWVVFNEGWGQHNTVEIVKKVMDYDKSRIIDGVTGWTDRGVGHMHDIHNYPVTSMILPAENGNRISVLGEFGGYGWAIQDHLWNPNMRNWGYKNIDGGMDLVDSYGRLMYDLETLIAQGLGAAIYTQTTDVEGEVNGLITYDRKIIKIPPGILHILHDRLYRVKPAKATDLITDGQNKTTNTRQVALNGKEFKATAFPYLVKPKSEVVSETEFFVENSFEHLSLWLNAAGVTRAWLNDTLIFEQEVKQTRHYSQYNVSDYVHLLRKGGNTLKVEVSNTGRMNFDYGLKAY